MHQIWHLVSATGIECLPCRIDIVALEFVSDFTADLSLQHHYNRRILSRTMPNSGLRHIRFDGDNIWMQAAQDSDVARMFVNYDQTLISLLLEQHDKVLPH